MTRFPAGDVNWGSDPAFKTWLREHGPGLTNAELAEAMSVGTGWAFTSEQVALLRRRFGVPQAPTTSRRAYLERGHCQPAVPAFLEQQLGPADAEHFVCVEGNVAVTSDWHIPHHDADLVERMLAVCRRAGVDQLIINGDFLNEDAFSRWPHHRLNAPWPAEKAIAQDVLKRLLDNFRLVVWTLDNHDRRILVAQEKQYRASGLDEHDIVALIAGNLQNGKLRASIDYHYVLVESGEQVWRVTSPKEYRRTKLSLANRLAQLYHQNIIVGGDHLSGVGTDDSGRYVVASNLSIVDRERTPYIQVQDTTFPHWQRGFHLIVEGVLYTFCQHPGMVNWDYWTNHAAPLVLPASAAPVKRRRMR